MKNKLKATKLDSYEQEIENNFEKTDSYPSEVKREKIKHHQAAATNYLKKDKRITIRVYGSDLERLKILAAEEGLPYQTYITSILHKVSTGRLKNVRG